MKTYIKEILNNRKNLDEENHRLFSEKICNKIRLINAYNQAENILFFYPYQNEVDIRSLVEEAFFNGKKVYFPRVMGETSMEFILVNSFQDLKEGYKGIKEPLGELYFHKTSITEKTCMIVPGSVFDLSGNRCGYGKGYYDRYLMDCFTKLTTIGVCFSLQILDKIPDVKDTDIPMDYVVNENQVIRSDT